MKRNIASKNNQLANAPKSQPPDTEPHREVSLALYRDAGDWARHYSNVRLTVAMVLVLGGLGLVLAWAVTRQIVYLKIGSLLLVSGLALFSYFTHLVRKMLQRQGEIKNSMLKENRSLISIYPWNDIPFLSLLIVCAAAFFLLLFSQP